jgi:PAS domain S-box-containing protein
VPVSVRIVTATHDGLPCTVAVARDLTEPQQLQSALQSTSAWLTLAAEGTLTGLWDWDLEADVTRYSPSWRRQLGYDDESFDGTWSAWVEILHPDDAERVALSIEALAQGRHHTYEQEIRVRHRDGDYRWMLSRAALVHDKSGRPIQLVGTHTDITRQKHAEEEIRRLNDQLMSEAEALARSNADLEAFGYSVWHDLRAPLRRVSGFTRILLEDHARELSPAGRDVLGHIAGGALRMGELIDDLFRLSQIGHADMRVDVVDLSVLARTVVDQLEQRYGDRPVAVVIAPDLSLTADRQLVRILLENVLDNAFKYTRKTPDPRVSVDASSEGAMTVFHVRDNGAGFDVANAERIFAPFQRFHSPEEFTGNGVGLAIVERVVRLHAGRIWIDSRPGEGTTVSFTLAASPPVSHGTARDR